MARINNHLLPAAVNEALIAFLGELPAKVLGEIGKILPGGFRDSKAIADRIGCMLRTDNAIPEWLLELLRLYLPTRQTIASLSSYALVNVDEALVAIAGPERTILALLVDDRPDVIRIGADLLKKPITPPSAADTESGKRLLLEFVQDHFLSSAGVSLDFPADEEEEEDSVRDQQQVSTTVDPADNASLVKRIELLKARQREKSAKAAKLLKAEREKSRREREEHRTKLDALTNERDKQAQECRQMRQQMQSEIQRAVADEVSRLKRKWLAAPLALEQAAVESGATLDDLISRAEAALKAQVEQDRHSGNRLRLTERLNQLQALRERLSSAASTALCVIPSLSPVLAEVELEIKNLEQKLSAKRHVDPVAERLLVRINATQTWPDLDNCSDLVAQLSDNDLIPAIERREVFEALQRKCSILEERSKAPTLHAETGWDLRGVIARKQPATLFLDGHNILLGAMRADFEPAFERGIPGQAAREKLIKVVSKLLEGRSNLQARILFDGPAPTQKHATPNVVVQFSGGTGKDRADAAIIEQLRLKSPGDLGNKRFVVSDDRVLRHASRKAGAIYVPVDILAILLKDFGCLPA